MEHRYGCSDHGELLVKQTSDNTRRDGRERQGHHAERVKAPKETNTIGFTRKNQRNVAARFAVISGARNGAL